MARPATTTKTSPDRIRNGWHSNDPYLFPAASGRRQERRPEAMVNWLSLFKANPSYCSAFRTSDLMELIGPAGVAVQRDYLSFAYSAPARRRMGMSGSASFQSAKNSS